MSEFGVPDGLLSNLDACNPTTKQEIEEKEPSITEAAKTVKAPQDLQMQQVPSQLAAFN